MVKKKQVIVNDKKWYQSKTMVINVLGFISGVTMLIQGDLQTGAVLSVAGILNAVLRYTTKSGIKF